MGYEEGNRMRFAVEKENVFAQEEECEEQAENVGH